MYNIQVDIIQDGGIHDNIYTIWYEQGSKVHSENLRLFSRLVMVGIELFLYLLVWALIGFNIL